MTEMRGLSLWQPWASLWALRAKMFETRSWETSYRGPIAIHAAAKSIKSILRECFPCGDWEYHPSYKAKAAFLDAIEKYINFDELPMGAIIGTAELVGCHKMVLDGDNNIACAKPPYGIYYPTPQELLFGNWTPGRYAWEITNVKVLAEPMPYKGAQGLWRIPNAEEILTKRTA